MSDNGQAVSLITRLLLSFNGFKPQLIMAGEALSSPRRIPLRSCFESLTDHQSSRLAWGDEQTPLPDRLNR